MALAPLLYNITFNSQTRILYFWDKAGHEIYHCEIPSPAPALPTVTKKTAQPFTYNSYISLSAGSESDLYVYDSGSYRALGYDSNNLYSIYGCYSDTYYGGQGWIRGVLFDTVISQNLLKAKNITDSTIPYIVYFSVAICSSSSATVITVYDSNNNPYNAFKYISGGTDYYYVLDGTQTDWTDDLSSIGYHVPPALPTVSMSYAYPNQLWNYSVNIGAGGSSVLRDQTGNALSYDSTKSYSALKYYTSTSDSAGTIDTNVSIGASGSFLALFNNGSSQITVQRVNVATCNSADATVITVYDSSNNPYNAFQYTSDGTDYYYVLDGTQTDWTDDLSSIGYHLPAQTLELVVGFTSSGGANIVDFGTNDYWYAQILSNGDKASLFDFGGEIISSTNIIKATPSFFYEVADIYTGNGTGSIPAADLSNFRCAIGTKGYPGALNIKNTNAYSNVMTWKVRITKVPNVAWVKADKGEDWTGYAGSLPLYDDNGNAIAFDSTKTYTIIGYYTSENNVDLLRMNTANNYGLSIINDSGYCKIKWADNTNLLIQRVIYKIE